MFADYMSDDVTTAEDAFNVALSECSTEQERQALITNTLTSLYGGAANTYRETAGAQMEAKEATAEATLAEANLADAIEPATTAWTNMKTTLLTAVAPAIEVIAGALTTVFEYLGEHPAVMYTIIGVLGVITLALGALSVATMVQAVANSALMVSLAPLIVPILAIVAAIAAVIAIIVLCVKYWDQIKAAAVAAWEWIKGAWETASNWFNENIIQPIANFFSDMWDKISGAAKTCWDAIVGVWKVVSGWFNQNIAMPVKNVFTGIWNTLKNGASNAWNGIKSVFSSVASFFGEIFTNAWTKVKNVFSTGGKIFDGIKDGIVSAFKTVVNAIISGINKVVSIPFNAINTALRKIRDISFLGISPFKGLIHEISIPSIPLLAEGGILTKPTLNIAGEAGTEAIVPIDKLQTYIESAIDKTLNNNNIASLVDAVSDLADRAIQLNINGRQFATATAYDADSVNGNRLSLQKRGLAL